MATSSSTFKLPYLPSHQYTVEVKNWPTILDNIRYWRVFDNYEQIQFFLQSKDEFKCANIDIDCDIDKNVHKIKNKVEFNELDKDRED